LSRGLTVKGNPAYLQMVTRRNGFAALQAMRVIDLVAAVWWPRSAIYRGFKIRAK
jgi:hypothetical protein